MTLKEKFKKEILIGEELFFITAECEKIADDYAIEFAEWVGNEWTCDERWSKITETKELLEIFKKEKGL